MNVQNIGQARDLLALLRCGLARNTSRRDIDEALRLTGDIPPTTLQDRLKAAMYADGGAWVADHTPKPAKRLFSDVFVLSAVQLDATDDTAGLEPEPEPRGNP